MKQQIVKIHYQLASNIFCVRLHFNCASLFFAAFTTDTQNKQPNNSILIHLFCGALAGGLAKTTIAPLDRAKINFQIQ